MTFLTNWGPKPMGTPSPSPDLRKGGKRMRLLLLEIVAACFFATWLGCGQGGPKFETPASPTPPPGKNATLEAAQNPPPPIPVRP
jgi:hypothetical protein